MIPPDLKPYLPEILTAVISFFIGWLFTRLSASAKIISAIERLRAEERRSTEFEARLAQSREEVERIEHDARTFRNQLAELRARFEAERTASAEKQAMITRFEAVLTSANKALSPESLTRLDDRVRQIEESRVARDGEIREQLQALAAAQTQIQHQTAAIIETLLHTVVPAAPAEHPAPASPPTPSSEPAKPPATPAPSIESFASFLEQSMEAEAFAGGDSIPEPVSPVPASTRAALARASELSARHQPEPARAQPEPSPSSNPGEDDFTFVPNPAAGARNAAADLRSALHPGME